MVSGTGGGTFNIPGPLILHNTKNLYLHGCNSLFFRGASSGLYISHDVFCYKELELVSVAKYFSEMSTQVFNSGEGENI